jgi:hypothetical protein
MFVPHGPKEIPKSRQVALPAELMALVNLDIGDQVYFARAEEPEGALLILPVELIAKWIDRGRNVTRSRSREADSTDEL